MKRKLKGAPSAPSAPNYYHHCHVNQPLPFFDSFCLGTGHASKKPQTLTPNTLFLTGIALRNSLRSILHHLPWGYDGLCLWLPLRVHPANSHCFLGRDQSGCDWSAFLGRCQWINYLVFFFLKKMRHQGVFQKKRIIYIYIYTALHFSCSIVVFRRFLLAAFPWHFDLQRNQDLWNFTALHGSTGFIHVPIETLQGRTLYLLENSWLKFGTRGSNYGGPPWLGW